MRTGFLRLGAALATCALLATACGAASAGARPAVPADASREDVDAVVAANTGFAIDLFRLTRQEAGPANLVIGPHSVSTAITIALGGAAGNTADELETALGHTLQDVTLHETVAALDASLRAREGGRTQLSLANRVWLQDDIPVVRGFETLLTDVYEAGPELVDFRTAAEAAIVIPKILGDIESADRLRWIVVNATYFNGDWANQFDTSQTSGRTFTLADHTTAQVPTMVGDFDVSTRQGSGWRSVRLPYRDGGLSMIVIVPDDLAGFVAGLDVDLWSEVAETFDESGTDRIEMPKFSSRWHGDLVPMFEQLGVHDAFDCRADFSGIFEFDLGLEEGDTNIGFIQHEAFIDVDESGTEAAAVTAVGGFQKVSAPLPDGASFMVDRPFVYAITDDLTGAILFLGQVIDPRIEAPENAPAPVTPRLC